ncbi:MAG: DUF4304 domain-containing protein [Cyclobacteriaceae bacterium]
MDDYLDQTVIKIKPILKELGFKKNRLNWYYENDLIIKIFNIQKSYYSSKVYLNIGIYILELLNKPSYSFPGVHIGYRLDHLVSMEILDYENVLPQHIRDEEYLKLLRSNPYEFFTLSGSKPELIKFIKEIDLDSTSVKAKEYLNI